MAPKTCPSCKTRRASTATLNLCVPCFEYSSYENLHSDEGHDHYHAEHASDEVKVAAQEMMAEGTLTAPESCLVCVGTDPAEIEPKKGHTNGIAKSHTSHAECKHESTKSARAKCRKERASVKGE